MRKVQVEKLWGTGTAGCFDGADVSLCCRAMAVIKDGVNSLKDYLSFWLLCQFMFLQPLYATRAFFVCVGKG